MSVPLYHVDAFTGPDARGNPAAVCLVGSFPAAEVMQSIAKEVAYSETAFAREEPARSHWTLRWFSPTTEIPLCGHATLATAHVLFHERGGQGAHLVFSTVRGDTLCAYDRGERVALDFPSQPPEPASLPRELQALFGDRALEVLIRDGCYVVRLGDEDAVRSFDRKRAVEALESFDNDGLVVTAPGREADFVSRVFDPCNGIDEDPVTGSTHTYLVPYWAERLGKTSFVARQLSERGGVLACRLKGDRVLLEGEARVAKHARVDLGRGP